MLDELVQSVVAHVRQIDVTDSPTAGRVHFLAVGLDHIQLAQAELVANRLNHHLAGAFRYGFELTESVTTSLAVLVSNSSGVCGARSARPLIATR